MVTSSSERDFYLVSDDYYLIRTSNKTLPNILLWFMLLIWKGQCFPKITSKDKTKQNTKNDQFFNQLIPHVQKNWKTVILNCNINKNITVFTVLSI